jgi:hypothetical protein
MVPVIERRERELGGRDWIPSEDLGFGCRSGIFG